MDTINHLIDLFIFINLRIYCKPEFLKEFRFFEIYTKQTEIR